MISKQEFEAFSRRLALHHEIEIRESLILFRPNRFSGFYIVYADKESCANSYLIESLKQSGESFQIEFDVPGVRIRKTDGFMENGGTIITRDCPTLTEALVVYFTMFSNAIQVPE